MKPVKPDTHFPTQEREILEYWHSKDIVKKGLNANHGKAPFVFYDGPPFATGLPHYGHILAGTLKDIVPRYWVMKGHYIERRWGWDCHGLPVEFEMENELGLNGLKDVEKYGIAKFNESCRSIVQRYTKEWEAVINRTGRWVNFENQYRTMDTPFMETTWWVFKQLWDKGLIYEGYRVMPYSWRIATPLSNFEAGLNYKSVQDPALTVRFKEKGSENVFLAWTTTPWTLPANLALCVSPSIDYVRVLDSKANEHLWLAKDRLGAYFKSPKDYIIEETVKGSALEGRQYFPLFPYAKDQPGAFRVLLGDHVTATDGTGIVHTAPAHGEEDFHVCQKNHIAIVDFTDNTGNITDKAPDFAGLNIKDADKEIIQFLKAQGSIYRHDTIEHNYAFCWRSDTPLMNKAISTWFVRVETLKERLIANNKQTHWVPEHLRDGRFGNWLENARDWNISRNRFWGTPLPVWRCSCGEKLCVSSRADLEQLSGKILTDLHKHFVDDVAIRCPKCASDMKRIPEVLDCWFESGSMPYGQNHYPFENKAVFDANFPADFIAEGIDQTRGWFYTLSVLSTALFDKPPFKNVVVNGLILAEDGKKMSKRLKNYPDPVFILDTYGADALRAFLMNSPASHAEDLRFSETGVKDVVRSVLLPLWNAYSFFVTYATADRWEPAHFKADSLDKLENDLDRWILSRLQTLIQRVDDKMKDYHLHEVVPAVLNFIDSLTNWHIRLNRRRFWSEEKSSDKELAYQTLYYVLREFSKILAPILPFITEAIYQNLGNDEKESVHLCSFPRVNHHWINADLEHEMELVDTVVNLGRNLRNTHKLKTRQPLKEFMVITREPKDRSVIEKHQELIANELNVKKVSFSSDEAQWVNFLAKPNAKVLGPRLGPKMKAVSEKIRALSAQEVATLESVGTFLVEGETITIDDVVIVREPRQAGVIQTAASTTVWLDSKLDEALINEGRSREFVNRVQKLRKDMGLQVTDRVKIQYACPPDLATSLEAHRDYICSETLCADLKAVQQATWTAEQTLDEFTLSLAIVKL
ncbi:MAG: isoleucine--tRNA ligase [Deltaproteobacteria bacterium]|nr:isoleucine--tRNA ligase [Deltaproteobacteria bacterium]